MTMIFEVRSIYRLHWIRKISRNIEHDDEVNKELLFQGWTVIRFWGKEITQNIDECIRVIEETIWSVKMENMENIELDNDIMVTSK